MSNHLLKDSHGEFRFLSIYGFPGWNPPTCTGRVHQKCQRREWRGNSWCAFGVLGKGQQWVAGLKRAGRRPLWPRRRRGADGGVQTLGRGRWGVDAGAQTAGRGGPCEWAAGLGSLL